MTTNDESKPPNPVPPAIRMIATMIKAQAMEGREVQPNSAATLALWVLGEMEASDGS